MESSLAEENVAEAVETAHTHHHQLTESLASLSAARSQIEDSARKTQAEIAGAFSSLHALLTKCLERRRDQLLGDVGNMERKALHPLHECHELIDDHLRLTADFLEEGNKILNNFPDINKETYLKFKNKSSVIGSLPEVPLLTHVPSISVSFAPSHQSDICSLISSYGKISRISPVQITECHQRPGSLFIKWEEIDSETEATEFQLQMSPTVAKETETTSLQFTPIYHGGETSFLVRDMVLHTNYTFRVCCRNDCEDSWSAWSLPFIAKTTVPPYEWDSTNPDYCLSNDNQIASKITNNPSVLHSRSSQYCCGHSLQFTVIQNATARVDEGIGLTFSVNHDKTMLLRSGVFFINPQGIVFVDGKEMKTRLPSLRAGSVLVFDSESLPKSKIRVSVACDDKTVAYDWKMDGDSLELYFLQFFRNEGWKILVE